MSTNQELDVIGQIRSKVISEKVPTGENLFLVWGYPTAFFLLLEFVALMVWNEDWCHWIWTGIPMIGTPLMLYFINEDYERTHHRTLEQNVILMMWVFIGFACSLGGFAMGLVNIYRQCLFPFIGLMCGMGCFMTGIILHFRPKTICGIIASVLSAVPLFFQGDLWPWQLFITAVIVIVALIIPGHLFRQYVRKTYK